MGAWIEMYQGANAIGACEVAPFMGAWIEMLTFTKLALFALVAPFMGAWIEIPVRLCRKLKTWSLPSWERGLKFEP